MRQSSLLCLLLILPSILIQACNRDISSVRFRNYSQDTVTFRLAYSHVRWYPESGYDLSHPQRSAGAVRPTLVSGLVDSRLPVGTSLPDSQFARHRGPDDFYTLAPNHTLWLAINRTGAGIPSLLTIDHRKSSVILTPDSITSLSLQDLSRDFF